MALVDFGVNLELSLVVVSRGELYFVSMPVVCLGWGGKKKPQKYSKQVLMRENTTKKKKKIASFSLILTFVKHVS